MYHRNPIVVFRKSLLGCSLCNRGRNTSLVCSFSLPVLKPLLPRLAGTQRKCAAAPGGPRRAQRAGRRRRSGRRAPGEPPGAAAGAARARVRRVRAAGAPTHPRGHRRRVPGAARPAVRGPPPALLLAEVAEWCAAALAVSSALALVGPRRRACRRVPSAVCPVGHVRFWGMSHLRSAVCIAQGDTA